MTPHEGLKRLDELSVGRLLDDLSVDEYQEYENLLSRSPGYDAALIERTVALAHLAALSPMQPMPARLRISLHREFDELLVPGRPLRHRESQLSARYGRAIRLAAIGWTLAAAASCLAVYFFPKSAPEAPVGSRVISSVHTPASVDVNPAPPPATRSTAEESSVPSLASQRNAFLATHVHAIQRAWREGGDFTGAGIKGDVVWDESSQTGYLRFVNLKRNEANIEQYQLWIFDGTRDPRYPVDGGVFDVISRDGEVIVPIRAKLPVRVPLAFAVTVERRGGVVVSDRSRLAAIANVS